jgi:hypothetical protein
MPSYSAVPERASIARPVRFDSMSAVEVEKSESLIARRPKVTIATRSSGSLWLTNVRAALPALARPALPIDRDVSIAITTLFAAPRLTASSPATGLPFSVRSGGVVTGREVTTLTTRRG